MEIGITIDHTCWIRPGPNCGKQCGRPPLFQERHSQYLRIQSFQVIIGFNTCTVLSSHRNLWLQKHWKNYSFVSIIPFKHWKCTNVGYKFSLAIIIFQKLKDVGFEYFFCHCDAPQVKLVYALFFFPVILSNLVHLTNSLDDNFLKHITLNNVNWLNLWPLNLRSHAKLNTYQLNISLLVSVSQIWTDRNFNYWKIVINIKIK